MKTIMDMIHFDDGIGDMPRRPSFWLDDFFFWTPIILEASGEKHIPQHIQIRLKDAWGGEVTYDRSRNELVAPIGTSCGYFNQYAEEMSFEPSASVSSECDPDGFYRLWILYHSMDIDKEPWLKSILLASMVRFRFRELLSFIQSELNRGELFSGDFIEDLLSYAENDDSMSGGKKSQLIAAIQEDEPPFPDTRPSEPSEYDVALTFAGEDRSVAKDLAVRLKSEGVSVFFDEDEQATLWGKNLYEHLSDVYMNHAEFCLMLISEAYARKRWPSHERKSAQARALRQAREYILPLRLDDTEIPGLSPTVAYIDLRLSSPEQVVEAVLAKLGRDRVQKTPNKLAGGDA